MYVLTIDQQDSRHSEDRVPELLAALGCEFERTVGDELQGVLEAPGQVAQAILTAMASGGWHIGLGAGDGERGDSIRAGRGPAFVLAREAVEASKGQAQSFAVRAAHGGASDAEALGQLLYGVIAARTAKQAMVAALLEHGATTSEVAESLGISPSAVSQRKIAGLVGEERAVRPLFVRLIGGLD